MKDPVISGESIVCGHVPMSPLPPSDLAQYCCSVRHRLPSPFGKTEQHLHQDTWEEDLGEGSGLGDGNLRKESKHPTLPPAQLP